MRAKAALVVSVVLLAAGSWLWITRESPHSVRDPETALVGQTPDELPIDSKREGLRPVPSLPGRSEGPSEGRTAGEVAPFPSKASRSESSSPSGATPGRPKASNGPRAGSAPERQRPVRDDDAPGDAEDFAGFKQRLAALRSAAKRAGRDAPLDPDSAGVSADDMDRLDLDQDHVLSAWELERARRLSQRAERHPVKNDLGDGAYPVERADYRRPEWEFDAVDTNRDGLLDVDEYYSFLFDAERTSLLLDADGDQHISLDESGLSEGEFAEVDRDGSGFLKDWEVRRAVAEGALGPR